MDTVPEVRPGVDIVVARDARGVTLSWSAYKVTGSRFARAGGLVFWLCLWAVGWVLFASAIVLVPGQPFLFVWFAGWTVGGALGLWKLAKSFPSVLPEFVRLEADRLEYYPGRGPSESRSCADLPGGGVMPVTPSPAADVPRAAIRGFVVDRVSGRQRLYFDANDIRTEIGGCLTEAERAWLLAVLQAWLGKPGRTPGSPGAVRSAPSVS